MFGVREPASLSKEELRQELAVQAAQIDAGLSRLLELAAEAERRLNWCSDGVTFARWLAWRCSLSPRQAREHVRVAGRLAELPAVRAAFARGEISYAKVSALCRVAEPENEQRLLGLAAVMTASQLERAVAAFRRVTAQEAAGQREREFCSWFWAEDGMLALRARLAPAEGALLLQALEAAREVLRERRQEEQGEQAAAGPAAAEPAAEDPAPEDPAPEDPDVEDPAAEDPPFSPAGEGRPPECRVSNAEALAALAELALAHPEGGRGGPERYQVVVHVDADALADHEPDGDGGRCELADGQPLAAETGRRLSCDASVVELVEREGEPLSLGRRRRTVSPPLRRALAARDRGCRFPGCDASRFLHAHHLRHWAAGGETSLGNLLLLCSRHHRLVHDAGYTVTADDRGELRWRNQHGVAVENTPRPPPCQPGALHDGNARRGLRIDARTCRNGLGDPMDLALTVDALITLTRPAAAGRPPT
jgi:hypothetical protein